jgi:hypothetical protein
MAKRSTASHVPDLTVRERVLLFCAASNTDWEHAGIPGETVTAMVVKGLIERDAGGRLARRAGALRCRHCCRSYDAQYRGVTTVLVAEPLDLVGGM